MLFVANAVSRISGHNVRIRQQFTIHTSRHRETAMQIEVDDLSRPAIHALLEEHLRNMREISPPESVHALDLSKLRSPDIIFWTVWEDAQLIGCGALKELDRRHGEI